MNGARAAPPASTPLQDYLFRERAVAWADVASGAATPLRFTDARSEHAATRATAGLFDFSFMACFDIAGPNALTFLERLQTRAVRPMQPGEISYTLLCREDGGVLNDATLWYRGGGRYTLMTGRRSDAAHLRDVADGLDVALEDVSARRAICAVQGPHALRVLRDAFPGEAWETLPYFGFRTVDFEGGRCDVGRLGYTGEAGFEAIVDASAGARLWQRLAAAGAAFGLAECGFEAANTLRIEAGFILFACELARRVTPFELRLGRLAAAPRARFIGARALETLRWKEPASWLVGLDIETRGKPLATEPAPSIEMRPAPGEAVLTSVTASPLYGRPIALGFVHGEDRYPGTRVHLPSGHTARVARLPFYDPMKRRPRRTWSERFAQLIPID